MLTNEKLMVGEERQHCNARCALMRSLRVLVLVPIRNADFGSSEVDGGSAAQGVTA
jgi:hypothetical protein